MIQHQRALDNDLRAPSLSLTTQDRQKMSIVKIRSIDIHAKESARLTKQIEMKPVWFDELSNEVLQMCPIVILGG